MVVNISSWKSSNWTTFRLHIKFGYFHISKMWINKSTAVCGSQDWGVLEVMKWSRLCQPADGYRTHRGTHGFAWRQLLGIQRPQIFPRFFMLQEMIHLTNTFDKCFINRNISWSGQTVAAKWFVHVLLTQHCAGDKIKKNEMGWACGVYGWGEGGV